MPEALLQAIVDTAMDGIIVVDADGAVVMFNPACERMFGYAASEVLTHQVSRLMPWPSLEEYTADRAALHATGGQQSSGVQREACAFRKDASAFPIEYSIAITQDRGRPVLMAVLRDITERKHAQAVRDEFLEKLTAPNEELGSFAQAASHDLQQGVRMVSSFCTLLSQQYGEQLDERGNRYLSLAIDAATQMGNLLEDLMHYSRLGLDAARPCNFSANVSLQVALDNLAESITETGARVTTDLLPELQGNKIRFTRLVQNLIANAVKYVPAGVAPVIHVSVQDEAPFWRFCVSDNGIGIEPQYRTRIFEPFKRLHRSDEYKGSGLGLSICKRIAEGFGGGVWVDSAPNGGSNFHFTIEQRQKEAQYA